jgi:hypothetical protein
MSDHPNNGRCYIEHDSEMEPVIITAACHSIRTEESSIEFLSVERVSERTQTARQIDTQ